MSFRGSSTQRPPKPCSLVARMVCVSGEKQGQGPLLSSVLTFPRLAAQADAMGLVTCLTGPHLLLAFKLLPSAYPSLPLSPKHFFQLWLTQNHLSQEHPKLACLFEPGGQQQPAGQRRRGKEGSWRPVQQKKEKTQHVALSAGRKSTDSFPPSP